MQWAAPPKQLCAPVAHSSICVHASEVAWYPAMHVHAPATRCGVAGGQLKHALLPGPLQVTQLPSHAPHVEADAA